MIQRFFLIPLLSLMALTCWSQQLIVPKKNVAETKWIHDRSYQMRWMASKDTSSFEIGIVNTNIKVSATTVLVITQVKLKASPSTWIDSTIVQKADLSPVYHSSYNAQRDMVLRFDKDITGYYHDKQTGKTTEILQNVTGQYFDSSFYPTLITWLPLKPLLKADINVFDYNPNSKIGLIKPEIQNVTEGIYQSMKSGKREVWVVEVTDGREAKGASSTYYIDKLTRQICKQHISVGSGRFMDITLME
jgi:hypothetical protein